MKYRMTCSLACCFLLTGWSAADPPRTTSLPIPPLDDEDVFVAKHLKMWRGMQGHMEGSIALQEKVLTELQAAFTPEQIDGLQRTLEREREELKKVKRWVQEMERYEQHLKLNLGSVADEKARARLDKMFEELWGLPNVKSRISSGSVLLDFVFEMYGDPPAIAPSPREVKK